MKPVICTLGILIALGAAAQTPPNPLAAPRTPAAPGLPASPSNPTLPTTPATPGFSSQTSAAGSTNALGAFALTNQFATNLNAGELATALTSLQIEIQRTLPLIAALEASFGLASSGTTLPPTASSAAGPAANLSQNLAGNAAANLAVNLAGNVATPTAGPPATPPSVFALGTNAPVPSVPLSPGAGGVTNVTGSSVGSTDLNEIATLNAQRDTIRLLVILENDLERVLPGLAALTGGGVNFPVGAFPNVMIPTNPATGFTNQITTRPTTVPRTTTTPRTLTPTGR